MISEQEAQKKRKIFSETDQSVAAMFKVLSDVNRYRIFRFLAEQPELTISNIAKIMNISLPLASQHIKILVHAKLVKKERLGKKIFPKVEHDNPFVQAIVQTIKLVQQMKPK